MDNNEIEVTNLPRFAQEVSLNLGRLEAQLFAAQKRGTLNQIRAAAAAHKPVYGRFIFLATEVAGAENGRTMQALRLQACRSAELYSV